MVTEVESSAFSQLGFIRLVNNQINMPGTELECLMDTLYSDAHYEDGDEWKNND